MKSFTVTATVALLLASTNALTIGSTLADCKNVARMFKNTCTQAPDNPADWTNAFQGATVSCTQNKCPDGQSGTSCTWTRKVCVSCYQSGADVYIRVQSNNLPDHCFSSPQAVTSTKIDFSVKFNPTVTALKTFASQSAFDTAVCSTSKTQTVPSESGFSATSSVSGVMNLNTLAGVGINGVAIFSSSSLEKVDPFYPQAWAGGSNLQAELVDACLAHPQAQGIYHYHILSPCLVNAANVQTTKACAMITDCASDLKGYALAGYDNYKSEMVLGIAKDGHMILGPYKNDGSRFDCNGFDQCGGTTSSDGSYAYVFSEKFPYSMDCYGPATPKQYEASCSSNTCNPSSSFGSMISSFNTLLFAALSLTFTFLA